MLLEVKCTVEHFQEFLNKAEEAGIRPDFDMHGADENSSFGSVAYVDDGFDENGVRFTTGSYEGTEEPPEPDEFESDENEEEPEIES